MKYRNRHRRIWVSLALPTNDEEERRMSEEKAHVNSRASRTEQQTSKFGLKRERLQEEVRMCISFDMTLMGRMGRPVYFGLKEARIAVRIEETSERDENTISTDDAIVWSSLSQQTHSIEQDQVFRISTLSLPLPTSIRLIPRQCRFLSLKSG